MSIATRSVQRVDRECVQQWLPLLDEWLLNGSFYGVQHTWPQLYRNDGQGSFFVMLDGERLVSHCACRTAQFHQGDEVRTVGLVGSVATAPDMRNRGLAGTVLQTAIDSIASDTSAILLWAERADLYARLGFVESDSDRCLLLARRPHRTHDIVRLANIHDHTALHALHESKPRRIARSIHTMSTLLTTPGMTTVVLERNNAPVAYASTGKGADLQGHWHELGGSDDDLAELVPAAMHLTDQIEAAILLPPYRDHLGERLCEQVLDEIAVPGPMIRATGPAMRSYWIDGLDSV